MASGTIKAVASKADVNALNDQNTKYNSATVISVTSATAFETGLNTLLATLSSTGETVHVVYNPNAVYAPFAQAIYEGTLTRLGSASSAVCEMCDGTKTVIGKLASGTWTWTSLNDNITNISSNIKRNGMYSATYQAAGVQIDANRIMCGIALPFATLNSDYTISDISCTILTIGTATATVDSKSTTGVRFSISHSGTTGQAFFIVITFKITL